jgi:hypothetical protein
MEERNVMRLRITLLIAALMMALTMSFGTVGAAFAAPETCWDGSKPINNQGTKECPIQPGKNENQDKFFQQESQKGSLSSSHPRETECGDPCHPGQFK